MIGVLKKNVPQQVINDFYHKPKAVLANVAYQFPARKLTVIGVTGTDGKTTTTNMIYKILKDAGKKVSMVSTINAEIAGKKYDTGFHVSSPDPFTVQKFANDAVKNKDEYLVLEVTSHAIDQYRFWGIKFDIGVITNITQDHLDYHKTLKNYFETKLKLLKNVKYAVINENLKSQVKDRTAKKVITFGFNAGDFNQKDLKLKLKMIGDYNVENALAALGVASVLNIDSAKAAKTLESFTSLKGRMEEINNKQGIKIFIDFASTANGLEQSLKALKKITQGRLISVFGSAGLRDVGKRAKMGDISTKLADFSIITSEDPRGYLEEINQQIVSGIDQKKYKENEDYFVIEDRKEAIEFAIKKLAKPGDTIGIFGKGHETSMNLDGNKEIPWSDVEAVKSALSSSS